jgi:hypothetical protein
LLFRWGTGIFAGFKGIYGMSFYKPPMTGPKEWEKPSRIPLLNFAVPDLI